MTQLSIAMPTQRSAPQAAPNSRRWRSITIHPLLYVGLGLAVFLAPIPVSQAAGFWTTSGKVTGTGQAVVATGQDPAEVRGWMTIQMILDAYAVPQAELYAAFGIPSDTPAFATLSSLETVAPGFSTASLRTWLADRKAR